MVAVPVAVYVRGPAANCWSVGTRNCQVRLSPLTVDIATLLVTVAEVAGSMVR